MNPSDTGMCRQDDCYGTGEVHEFYDVEREFQRGPLIECPRCKGSGLDPGDDIGQDD